MGAPSGRRAPFHYNPPHASFASLSMGCPGRRQRVLRLDARQRDEPRHPRGHSDFGLQAAVRRRLYADVSGHGLRRAFRRPRVHLDGVSAGQARGARRRDRDAARPGCAEHDWHGVHRARTGVRRGTAAAARARGGHPGLAGRHGLHVAHRRLQAGDGVSRPRRFSGSCPRRDCSDRWPASASR